MKQTFKSFLSEMAISTKFYHNTKDLVKAFKAGQETFEFKDGSKTFKFNKKITATTLEAGQIVLGSTKNSAEVYEILGFAYDNNNGSNGIVYKTCKELLSSNKSSTLKGLEKDTVANGPRAYIVVKDLENKEEGAWFYIYEGNWCLGSSADKLSFCLIEEVK